MVYNAQKKSKLFLGAAKVRKVYLGTQQVYSSGNIVTYKVDSSVTYTEEVDEGATVLSPKSFTPAKSGWTFLGWRQDTTATSTVLSSLNMGDNPITLYAVFRQTVTLSYNGNGATSGSTASQTGYRYYNNTNVANPSFTLRSNGYTRTGYNFLRWRQGSASGTAVSPGSTLTLSASTTLYAEWQVSVVNISTSNITTQFPNRSVWSTGNIGNQSNPDTLSIGGHNGSVDMTMGFSTGNFTISAGAKTITLTARVSCWGTWSALGWTLACSANGASQSTLINGGNGQAGENIVATFSVNGATTISLSCSITWSHDFTGQGDGVWYSCSFVSAQINY